LKLAPTRQLLLAVCVVLVPAKPVARDGRVLHAVG